MKQCFLIVRKYHSSGKNLIVCFHCRKRYGEEGSSLHAEQVLSWHVGLFRLILVEGHAVADAVGICGGSHFLQMHSVKPRGENRIVR